MNCEICGKQATQTMASYDWCPTDQSGEVRYIDVHLCTECYLKKLEEQ